MAGLEQAFEAYRLDLEASERRRRPTDGLLGFGRAPGDDPCHGRLDERLQEEVQKICALPPSPEEALQVTGYLLMRDDVPSWPPAAQWMLRAAERHALPLIPCLSSDAAGKLLRQYTSRYRPWDRLPAQKEICKALKERACKA